MKSEWVVSDVLDDDHNGIIRREDNGIIIGAASPLSREQAQKICDIHNWEVSEGECREKYNERRYNEMIRKGENNVDD